MKKLKTLLLSMVFLLSAFGFADDRKSTTTIVDPVGNVTTEVFYGPYPFETKVFKGSSTLLSTTDSCYNGASFPCSVAQVAVPVTQKDVFSTVVGTPGPSQAEVMYSTYGLVTDSKVYNYGPSLVNEGVVIYSSLGNVYIRNRPSSVTTKDSGGTTVAQTTFTYDAFGDVLTRNMLVGGSTFLTETFTYTSKGMIATSTGINGAVTSYNNSLCNGMDTSSVTYPVTGTQTYTWNCNGNVPTSTTDVNGSILSVAYADPFWRTTSSTDSLGTTTTYKYSPKTEEVTTAFANSVNDKLTTLNSAGHVFISQIRQSAGAGQYDTNSQSYDTMGRIVHGSVPCVTSGSSPCPSADIRVSYDTGAVPTTVVTDSLGGVVTTKYSANDETTLLTPVPAGENVKGKQLEYDGLGRLTSTCEISSGAGSGSCGQRVAQTGYATTYTYDAMGNVLTITQGSQTRTRTYDDLGRVLTSTEPETGITTFTYDTTGGCGGTTSNGNLVSKVDANGNTFCYKYDAESRLTSITYSGPNATDSVFYVYDSATVNGQPMLNAKGRLAEAYTCTSCPGTKKTDTGFSYDKLGQTTDIYESTTNSGGYYHVALTVYPNQSIHTLQLTPAVIPTITYGLDGEGRTSTVQDSNGSLITSTARGANSQISSITYGTADVDAYGYDSLLRMTQYAFSSGGNSVVGSLSYNSNGTVAGKVTNDPFKAANNETCAYSYDDLVRLVTSNCGAVNQSFSYDRYGNITKSGTFSFAPTYSTSTNRIVGYTYDANGNILTDGTSTYTWDAEGRMLSGPGVDSIIYNALGLMAEQTRGASHQQIVYFPSGEKLALMNGQVLNLARVPLTGGAQAIYTSTGLAYFSHSDSLGSVRFTTAPDRSVSSDLAYASFGEPYNNSGVLTSVLSFTGLNQDTITGLYDTSTRKYNPLQSRWVSSDRNNNADSTDPQSFNLYSYVMNRPLDSTDPTGSILDNSGADDGSDLPYGPGCPDCLITDPSTYDPYGFLDADSEKPLVFNADEPAGGAGGSFSTWDQVMSAIGRADPTGLVAGFDVPFFVGPYEGVENVILRIARGLEGTTGTGKNSLKNIEDLTYKVLDNYGSLTTSKHGPALALGLTNPGKTREEVRALGRVAGSRSGLNLWAESIGAKTFSSFPVDSTNGLKRGLFTLMDNVRDAGGTIHFSLDGLIDIPKAVAGTSSEGTWVESLTGGPMIKVPYNSGYTIAELRYLKDNWGSFKACTIFYKDGIMMPSGAGASMKAFSDTPFVPWYTDWRRFDSLTRRIGTGGSPY